MSSQATPLDSLDAAGRDVRAFLHKTGPQFRPEVMDWSYPSHAYRALGELGYLVGLLPQVCDHIIGALRRHLDDGAVGIDPGTAYAGHPDAAVESAGAELDRAQTLACSLRAAIENAQNAINAAHHVDRC